jgi:ethanolamine utilization protein EutQ
VEPNPVVDDLLYILEGEIEVEMEGRRESFGPGDFAYLTAGPRRVYRVDDRVKLIYVTYPCDWQAE